MLMVGQFKSISVEAENLNRNKGIMAGRVLDKALQSFGRPAPCPVGYIWDEDKKKCIKVEEMTKAKTSKIANEILKNEKNFTTR